MKDYIKPTFVLAGLFPVALAGSCTYKFKGDFLETIYVSLDIPEKDYGNTFAESEGCKTGIPDFMVDFYCKFTSTEETTGKALTS